MTSANTQWFLAIDSNCAVCDDIGNQLRSTLDNKVTVVSLHADWISELRLSHFGERSPWAPTLISLRHDGEAKLWVGKVMPFRLATVIGLRRALEIAKMLGDTVSSRSGADEGNFVSRRTLVRQLAGVTAGLSMAAVVGETVLADSPESCGIYQTYGGYTSMTANYANCRHCPSINSPSAIGGSLLVGPIQFRYYAYGGGVPGSPSSLWWRTAGPTGCWVHSSAVS